MESTGKTMIPNASNSSLTREAAEQTAMDDAIQAQERAIESEVAAAQRMVNDKEPIENLQKDYNEQETQLYLHKAKDLAKAYGSMRRVRGDGNCFYRAFIFAQAEVLMNDAEERARFYKLCSGWKARLLKLGFPDFTTADFCDTFFEFVKNISEGKVSAQQLLDAFNDDQVSNYYVVFARLVASGYLQENEEFYSNFVDGSRSIQEFCKEEIDPMFKVVDHLCISALTQALGIPIRIEYIDRSESPQGASHHDFLIEGVDTIRLYFLYRHDHYDILYRR